MAKTRPLPPSSTGGTDWSGSHAVTIALCRMAPLHVVGMPVRWAVAGPLVEQRVLVQPHPIAAQEARRFLPLPLGVLVVRLPPRALCVADARGLRRAWVGRGSPSISTGTLAAGAVREEGCRESAAWLAAHARLYRRCQEGSSQRAAFDLHAFTRRTGTPNSSAPFPHHHHFITSQDATFPFCLLASSRFLPRLPHFLPPSQDPSCCSFAFPPATTTNLGGPLLSHVAACGWAIGRHILSPRPPGVENPYTHTSLPQPIPR